MADGAMGVPGDEGRSCIGSQIAMCAGIETIIFGNVVKDYQPSMAEVDYFWM